MDAPRVRLAQALPRRRPACRAPHAQRPRAAHLADGWRENDRPRVAAAFDAIFCYDTSTSPPCTRCSPSRRGRTSSCARPPRSRSGTAARFREIRTPGIADAYLARYNWDYTIVEAAEPWRRPCCAAPTMHGAGGFSRERLCAAELDGRLEKQALEIQLVGRGREGAARRGVPRIVVTSGGQDWQREHSQKIAQALGDRALYLGGQTRLEEFLWLVSRSRMVIGVDGAASHLSAAFGGKKPDAVLPHESAQMALPDGDIRRAARRRRGGRRRGKS